MLKKTIIAIVKLTLIVGLFAFLTARALQGAAFSDIRVDGRGIAFLSAGFLFSFVATTITVVRW